MRERGTREGRVTALSARGYDPSIREPLRLLFVLPYAPSLDAMDGGRATAQLLVRLAAGHTVGVVHARSVDDRPADDAVRAVCAFVHEAVRTPGGRLQAWARNGAALARLRPIRVAEAAAPGLAQLVRRTVEDFRPDVVHLEPEEIAAAGLRLGPGAPARSLTVHDPGVTAARERLGTSAGAVRRAQAAADLLAWQVYERRLLRAVDRVVTFSDGDAAQLVTVPGRAPITTIPLGSDLPEAPLNGAVDPGAVLFIGGYQHEPNVDAALRLGRAILPRVLWRRPDATLTLVGKAPTPEVRALAGERVTVPGTVPDVTPYVARAAVIALPIRLGGGMRVKLLEALSAGKAVVASPLAARGLAVSDGRELLLAEDDATFADAIARLLDDEDERRALGTRAHAWAREHLGWDARVREYEAHYRAAIG